MTSLQILMFVVCVDPPDSLCGQSDDGFHRCGGAPISPRLMRDRMPIRDGIMEVRAVPGSAVAGSIAC